MSRDESGIAVYPRLPVPPTQRGEPPPLPRRARRSRSGLVVAVVVAALAGGAGVWFLAPVIAPDARIAESAQRASEAEKAAAAQKTRAGELEKKLDETAKAKRDAEAKLAVAEAAQSELAGKVADEAGQHKAAEAVQQKLKAAAAGATEAVTAEGNEVHLRLADHLLFKPYDDALTDRGKAVLAKLAGALKQLPDQQVWVQGHTDDQLIPQPKAPPQPPAKKGKPAPPPPAPVRFATTWELSAARALAVVHYFQDVGKLEPSRLAALAFAQYAPVPAAKDRSANRRLEIVLRPRKPAK